MKKILIAAFSLLLSANAFSQDDMDLNKLKLALAQRATVVNENNNVIEYELDGVRIYLITDTNANRMRMVSAIEKQENLSESDLTVLMQANFDRALDAKYALSDSVLWSVYAHPLKELQKEQLIDAMYQVKNLVNNYGTTYVSTDFVFGGGDN